MNIGDRMKKYEAVSNYLLLPKECVFVRIDGKAFHTFTRKFDKPFDDNFIDVMIETGEIVAKEMMNFIIGYQQSDEFTFMLKDTKRHETQPWFNNEIQKISSISSSLFTANFNNKMNGTTACFDSRAYNVPSDEAPNVFIWRQRDWERNSIQMYARSFYSHKELKNKNHSEIHEMLHKKNKNWSKLNDYIKNGTFITVSGKRINKKMNYLELSELIKKESSALNN